MFGKLQQKIRLLRNKNKEPYSSLYKLLGFYPNDTQLYELAFLHKSSSIENNDGRWVNNERLEFLGDAILDAIVAAILYDHFTYKKEGFLTNTRSKIVKRDSLNHIAQELGLDKMVVYSTKIATHNNHLYGNALEALIGAIYLDQGYDVCAAFVKKRIIQPYIDLETIAKKEINFKSVLLEWGQKNRFDIDFNLLESFTDTEGNPVFQTEVKLGDIQIGIGIGFSKKESHQNASKMAVKKLRTDKEFQEKIKELKRARNAAANNSAVEENVELPDDEHELVAEEITTQTISPSVALEQSDRSVE